MDYRQLGSNPEARYTSTKALESIEADRAHGQCTLAEPRLTILGNRSSAAHRDHGLGLVNTDTRHHSFINTMVHFHFILSFICEDKHLQSFYLSFRV